MPQPSRPTSERQSEQLGGGITFDERGSTVMIPRTYDRLYIGGEWVVPHSDRAISSIDPASEAVWAEVPEADEQDVDRAVLAARQAMNGPWASSVTPSQRGALLISLASLLERDAGRLAELESTDNGKPIRDTLSEVQRAIEWFTYFAGAADKIQGNQIPFRPNVHAYTQREPIGVVAAIAPWNSPLLLYSWKLAPALAAGNAVVLKPAEQTPVTAMELARLVDEAGFPRGTVNVVPGYGSAAGKHLVEHPVVNKISFTGSHETARVIGAAAVVNMTRCTFECGGKSPNIVFPDADLERAIEVVVNSAFRSTGQSCSLGSRLIVHRDIYEHCLEALCERAKKIQIGHPLDDSTEMGPHTSAEQLAKTASYIALGIEEGSELVSGGGRPTGFDQGYFIEPTIFSNVDNRSRLAQEEIFGPVLSVISFDDEADAVALANDVKYGLVAGVWTSDVSRAHRMASAIQSGLVTVNTFRTTDPTLPYGGYKMSGIGRENGLEVLHYYTDVKTVVVDLGT